MAIPLFVSDEPDNKNFAAEDFTAKGKAFAFCRVIEDLKGGGILIEVFDLVGTLEESLERIINAPRLFPPVAVSGLEFHKKRWKKIYLQADYDKQKDSRYPEIGLVMGEENDWRLWQNGKEKPITASEAEKYEEWEIWGSSDLEKRIIQALVKN